MSTSFDISKAYADQEDDVYFDDGREIELLHFVFGRPDIDALRGSPAAVLAAIDEYGRTRKYLMNVGEDKGRIVTDLIAQTKPKTMVELGGYVGYSTILFGDALRRASGDGARLYSLERNPEFAAVIGLLVDLAGLASVVRVVVGPSDASLRRLHASGALPRADLLFLDHYKPAYLPDLKLCESLGIVGPGSVLAADNVVKPGNPPYLAYVRSSVEDKRAEASKAHRLGGRPEVAFDERVSRQYERREGVEQLDGAIVGNPDLRYQSELVNSFEPTGIPDAVEITRCIGVES